MLMNILEGCFSFRGRVGRLDFWLNNFAIGCVLVLLAVSAESFVIPFPEAALVVCLLLSWWQLAVSVKRWHDRNKSGWWVLISIVPIIGPLWALVEQGFLSGTHGRNDYGAMLGAG